MTDVVTVAVVVVARILLDVTARQVEEREGCSSKEIRKSHRVT